MSSQGRQYPDGPLEPPPGVSVSAQCMALGADMAAALVAGLSDPRPLTAQEMADLAAHAGGVARRSFPALYEDGDPSDPEPGPAFTAGLPPCGGAVPP